MSTNRSDGVSGVEHLAQILERHALTRLEYEQDGCRIVLEKLPADVPGSTETSPAATFTAVSTTDPVISTATPEAEVTVVRTPLVGLAYRSREPGAAPFVTVGDTVNKNDVLCLVEAMKMFNEIVAPVSGLISAIHFEDGALVEYDAPLISIG